MHLFAVFISSKVIFLSHHFHQKDLLHSLILQALSLTNNVCASRFFYSESMDYNKVAVIEIGNSYRIEKYENCLVKKKGEITQFF